MAPTRGSPLWQRAARVVQRLLLRIGQNNLATLASERTPAQHCCDASRKEKALKLRVGVSTWGLAMAEAVKKPRPEYRNISIGQILTYRLPLAGRVSILHRVSGALLFLLLPFSLYLLEQSLTSELSFASLKAFFSYPLVKLIVLVLSWAYLFHFCAGLRHLLLDTHRAVTKQGGKQTSIVVFVVSSVLTIAVALKLFGVF
jgi:succinate dehydrogenase / fumarate reductase cytochrome b subunit